MSTSRQSIQTLRDDLSEVLAWGAAAEAANAAIVAERDAAIALVGDRDIVISNLNQWLAAREEERDRLGRIVTEQGIRIAELTNLLSDRTEELEATDASLAASLATIAEKDATIAARDQSITALEWGLEQKDVALAARNAEIAEQDEAIYQIQIELGRRSDEIERLKAELALYKPSFTVYNEYRSAPSLPNTTPIRVINQSEMVAPGRTAADAPDVAFIDDLYDELIAAGHTWVVSDNETWAASTNGVITTANMVNFVTLAERAALKGLKYSQYQYPYRTTSFISGSGDINTPGTQNYDRKQTFFNNVIGTQALTDLMTGGLTPNFYYMSAVQSSIPKMMLWIDTYVELWQLIAPNKPMIPFVWPRLQNNGSVWIDGPMYRATVDKLKERCSSMILFGRSGNDDPDPRTLNPVPAWWVEHEAAAL